MVEIEGRSSSSRCAQVTVLTIAAGFIVWASRICFRTSFFVIFAIEFMKASCLWEMKEDIEHRADANQPTQSSQSCSRAPYRQTLYGAEDITTGVFKHCELSVGKRLQL